MTSSGGYAERLSTGAYKGRLGLRNAPDPPRAAVGKAKALADLIRSAEHVVVHTGAGLSTSAGIPDFRGPAGIWTMQRAAAGPAHAAGRSPQPQPDTTRRQLPSASTASTGVSFEAAAPTLAHMVIVALQRAGWVKYVVSQNVDALHLRSGLPRDALSELHGNLFVEECPICKVEYLRDFETKTVGFKHTGRACPACGAGLTDKALDWHDSLPEPDFGRALRHCAAADVAVVVGSSCQMDPARGLPFRSKQKRCRTALVNLSRTDMDDRFSVTIRAPCDTVFAVLASELNVVVPKYERRLRLHLQARRNEGAVRNGKTEQGGGAISGCGSGSTVRCSLWSGANADCSDAIPLIASVTFEVVNAKAVERSKDVIAAESVSHAPYGCTLSAPGGATLCVRALVEFSSPRAEGCELECVVGEKACVREVVADAVDYGSQASELVRLEEAAARRGRKRAQGSREGRDASVWFCRSSARRGYVRCAGCLRDVAACKKREHLAECLGAAGEA